MKKSNEIKTIFSLIGPDSFLLKLIVLTYTIS